jgi:hypothetical protein
MKRFEIPLMLALLPALAILLWAGRVAIDEGKRFVAGITETGPLGTFPGEMTFTCQSAEPQLIWLYTSILYEGRQYATAELPAGATLQVESLAGSQRVEVRRPHVNMTKNAGQQSAEVVGEFTPPAPGEYRLTVSSPRGGPFVLAVTPDDFGSTVFSLFRAIGMVVVGFFGAVLVFGAIFLPFFLLAKKKSSPPPLP